MKQTSKRGFRHASGIASLLVLSACGSGGTALLGNVGGADGTGATMHQVSGSLSGLAANGLVLSINGTALPVAANSTSFAFPSGVAAGTSYAVTVSTQPTGQTCTINNGTGTIGTANVANVAVTCVASMAATTYQVSGSLSGVTASGLVLSVNGTPLPVAANASNFAFPSGVTVGTSYAVTVSTQPTGQTCTVNNGTGTIGTANVANVVVTCAENAYSLGGSISGLISSGLVLANGSDTVTAAANATSFTFPTAVATGASYAVTVRTQPMGLACAVTHDTGTMSTSAISAVMVTCTDQSFTLGAGSISGLTTGGLTLSINGGTPVPLAANATTFSFPAGVPYGSTYAVTVASQPTGLTCTVINGAGTMPASNVNNIGITCAADAYTLGGSISGLTAGGLVLSNGSDTLTVTSGATAFTLPTAVAYGSSYAVLVSTQPAGLTCTVSNGMGTMPAAAVSNVAVACAAATYTLGGTISGVITTGLTLVNGSDTLAVAANATVFTLPTAVAFGASYNVHVTSHPGGQFCAVSNGSGTASGNVTTMAVTCVAGTVSLVYAFAPSGSDGQQPYGSLIQGSDGNFYGLTQFGGVNGSGTVFKVTPSSVESVLWSFGSGNDGRFPSGTLLLASDGNFYGVTETGGSQGFGTVFKITPAGVETVVYSFTGGNDGSAPYAGLIQASDGNLYGLTLDSGSHAGGVVYKITLPAGIQSVVHAFGSGSDAANPEGNLVQASDGNLYGLTRNGGANSLGAVFKTTLAGVESVLYSFGTNGGSSDGARPYGSVIQATDGNLYGMTSAGGANNDGTVFKISLAGAESVLHSFSGSDGASPYGSLIQGFDGDFYGMTFAGGTGNAGTVIRITPAGAESVVYSFLNNSFYGSTPYFGSLFQTSNGDLFGLAAGGGNGDGTVFKIN